MKTTKHHSSFQLAACTATDSAASASGVDAANPLAVNAINYYGMIEQMLQQMTEPATAATARRRTASTGVDMRAMMRATQTISGQVCSGVCAKVSEVSRKRNFTGITDHRLAYCRWTTSWIFEFHNQKYKLELVQVSM